MATHPLWRDEYWLLLMQLYLKKPVGVKPLYSKAMVELSLELHIAPQVLYQQMFRLRQIDTPQMEKLWAKYGKNPRKLSREVNLLRQMNGYGTAGEFYEGVDVNESFEKDFRPVSDDTKVRPVDLIMILDLYFRLTPLTMVAETPEIQELAKMLKMTAGEVSTLWTSSRCAIPTSAATTSSFIPCSSTAKRCGANMQATTRQNSLPLQHS